MAPEKTATIEQRSIRHSYGERQRLLLALAPSNYRKIIFLDKPTTGLTHSHGAISRC